MVVALNSVRVHCRNFQGDCGFVDNPCVGGNPQPRLEAAMPPDVVPEVGRDRFEEPGQVRVAQAVSHYWGTQGGCDHPRHSHLEGHALEPCVQDPRPLSVVK